jgi:hypothetical protein
MSEPGMEVLQGHPRWFLAVAAAGILTGNDTC